MSLLNRRFYGTGYRSAKAGNQKELEPKNLFRRSVTQTDEESKKIDGTSENPCSTSEGLSGSRTEKKGPSDQHNLYVLRGLNIILPMFQLNWGLVWPVQA